jgi:hypothetical protein
MIENNIHGGFSDYPIQLELNMTNKVGDVIA